jgi:hypothetical protein
MEVGVIEYWRSLIGVFALFGFVAISAYYYGRARGYRLGYRRGWIRGSAQPPHLNLTNEE